MAELTLKTRLLNKYNQTIASDTVLGKGEINFVEVSIPLNNGSEGKAVLMKVGDGTTTYGALDYVAAKAADVYAWAKEEGLTVTKEGTGNVVSGIAWDATLNGGKGGIKFTTAAVATSEGLKDLQDRVGIIEGDYITEAELNAAIAPLATSEELATTIQPISTDLAKKANSTDVYTKTESDGKYATISTVNSVKATADAAAVASEVNTALASKVDKVAGKSLVSDTEITKLAGVSAGANKVEESSFNGNIKIDGKEIGVYYHPTQHSITEVRGLQDALDGKVAKDGNKVLSTNDLTNELKTNYDAAYTHSQTAHAPANAQANIIESVKVNGSALSVTGKAVDISVPTNNNQLANGAGYLVASDIANKADKETTLAGYGIGDAYTKTETEGKIESAINTFVSAYITSDGGAIDKLQEIADWIDSDKDGAADIIADVEANTDGIEDINNTLNTYGDIVTHNASEFATAAQGAKADSAVQTVKVLGQSLTQTSNELTVEQAKTALGLGSAAYTASTAYATAAQGLKSVAEGNGIVATFANNILSVGLDTSVTFVLDANS